MPTLRSVLILRTTSPIVVPSTSSSRRRRDRRRRRTGIEQAVAIVLVRLRAAQWLGGLFKAGEDLVRRGTSSERTAGDDQRRRGGDLRRGHRRAVDAARITELARLRRIQQGQLVDRRQRPARVAVRGGHEGR